MNRALFLDRDGTINVDRDYLINPSEFEFEKNVIPVLKQAYKEGYLLIVITNQSGIARGFFSEEELHVLHEYIQKQAENQGFKFTEFFYCPHLKDGIVRKYSYDCGCRKPKTELLKQAIEKYNIDIQKSFVIGDKKSDILLGQAMGIKTVLVGTGYGTGYKKSGLVSDYFIEDFSGLSAVINLTT